MERRRDRHQKIEERHPDCNRGKQQHENSRATVEDAGEREGGLHVHASTARPLSANNPRGRFWMNNMMSTRIAILASTAPATGSRNLLAIPSVKAPTNVPQRLPT